VSEEEEFVIGEFILDRSGKGKGWWDKKTGSKIEPMDPLNFDITNLISLIVIHVM